MPPPCPHPSCNTNYAALKCLSELHLKKKKKKRIFIWLLAGREGAMFDILIQGQLELNASSSFPGNRILAWFCFRYWQTLPCCLSLRAWKHINPAVNEDPSTLQAQTSEHPPTDYSRNTQCSFRWSLLQAHRDAGASETREDQSGQSTNMDPNNVPPNTSWFSEAFWRLLS